MILRSQPELPEGFDRELALSLLDETTELLRKGWIQNNGARDANGNFVLASSDNAVCFCLQGAVEQAVVRRAKAGKPCEAAFDVLTTMFDQVVPEGNWVKACYASLSWNDHPGRTQEEVVEFVQTVRNQLS